MSSSETLPAALGPEPTEQPAATPAGGKAGRKRWMELVEAYALLILLVVVGVFFTFFGKTSDTFLTSANLQVLVAGQVVVAVVALALLVPLCANEWDLSVGAVAGLSAVFSAVVMSSNGLLLGILVGVGIGALVGLVNALIVTRLNVNAVIATLGMATIVAGVINLKTAGLPVVSDIPETLTNLGSGTWLGIPRLGVLLVVVSLLVHYVLGYTPYGRYLYALGANPLAARLVGLRTKLLLGLTFVFAGVLAGIGGILAVARAGGADPKLGDQLLLPAFAAAFLSAASIKPGRYNVGGLLVAVYFLAVLNNGLNLAGVRPYVNLFVNGTALIIGVALATYLGRRRRGTA
jgi:ribose transport system permease protein